MNNKINTQISQVTQRFVNQTQKESNGVVSMKDNIAKAVNELIKEYKDVKDTVSIYKEYIPVTREFEYSAENLVASKFAISITKPPKTVENHEIKRYIELFAYKNNSPYKAGTVVAAGNKDEILEKLQEPKLIDSIEAAFKRLSNNLKDM